jgi:hypothetical protein
MRRVALLAGLGPVFGGRLFGYVVLSGLAGRLGSGL